MSTALIDALKVGDRSAVVAALEHDPPSLNRHDEAGLSPVLVATYHGHQDLARLLIERGADLDICAAAATGAADALERLIAADPGEVQAASADGWTPLHLAAHFGQKQAVEALIRAGAAIDARSGNDLKNTPLHAAIAGRQDAVAGLLLASGADIDASDASGYAALHIAAFDDQPDIIKLLLIHGAEVNPRDHQGRTPLGLAEEKGFTRVIDMLSAYGGEA